MEETLRKYPQVPFILLSTSPSLESVIEALKQGAYDFLRKPVDPGILLHAVARATQKLDLSLESEKTEREAGERLARIEEELRKARLLGAYKGFLVSMMGHDFKSILTVLDGYMQILTDKCAACTMEEAPKLLNLAGRTLTRLRIMANTLLDYEAAEKGQLRIEPTEFLINSTLDDCVTFYRPYAEQKRVKVLLERNLPRVKVKGDPTRVFQILDNLLYNAIKFTPPDGEIRLGVRLPEDGSATAWVHDSGVGIHKTMLEKIFSENLVVSDKNATARIGLGLNIAKKLIEAQNGKIWVESEPGKGTKVLFSLPG
jgi:signal transduction histidine kinase